MAIKKLTSKDIIWQTITASKKQVYIVSSNQIRSEYSLWQKNGDGTYKHLASASSPVNFQEQIIW